MERPPLPTIPYHKQEAGWTCGAATLRMAYASFGLELTEAEVWAGLSPGRDHRTGVRTSRLAWDARGRGFAALAVQARQPWGMLSACARLGFRAVVSHPLFWGSSRRHFSILAAADESGILLHDPQAGPALPFGKDQWLELWGAAFGNFRAV